MAKSKTKKTKTDRLYDALSKGQTFTAEQAIKRFGFASQGSFSGTVTYLRNEGHRIECIRKAGAKAGRYQLMA